jgi:hypothetical protein
MNNLSNPQMMPPPARTVALSGAFRPSAAEQDRIAFAPANG